MRRRIRGWGTAATCLVLMGCLSGSALGADSGLRISVVVDREDGIYRCGEMAAFTISVTKDGKAVEVGEVTVRVETWGKKCVHEEELKVEGQPLQVRMTSEKPGFLVCQASYRSPEGHEANMGTLPTGVGFDPEKIDPVAVMPDDFEAFWETARKERDAIPLDLKLDPCAKYSTAAADVFIVSVANVGDTRAYGYLSVPKSAKPPLPVSIVVPGAGPGPYGPRIGKGTLCLYASVHVYRPFEGEPSREELSKVYPGDYKKGAPDRKKYSFYRSILGIDRLIGYVASRPDVDRTQFAISGISQGGGLALILGGLNNDKFTSIWSDAAGMCDHAAYRLDRETSWPGLIPPEARKDPVKEPVYREFSAYFDAVNFARRIKCPTKVGAGLGDSTCAAANIYAAYNVIRAPKRIFTCQGGHPVTPLGMRSNYVDKEWDEVVKKAGEEIGRAAAGK